MKKRLIVKQDGYKECGVACLLSIIKYYNGNISINKLLELTHTDKNGTSFYNLREAALKLGLEALGFKVNKEEKRLKLKKIILPSICQIVDNNYEHFVVLYQVKLNKVIIMDPARGFRNVDIEDFLNSWTGYIMCFSKTKPLPYIKEEKYLNKIIIESLQKNRSIVLNIILLSIIFTIFSSVYAMYSGIVIDSILDTSKNNLLVITVIFSVLLLIKCISNFFRNNLLIHLNQKLDCSIFLNAFQKIILLPYSYYKNRTTGEVITRINDLSYVKNMLSKIVLTVFLDLIISLTCAFILFKINAIMFFLLIITILIYIIIFCLFRPFIKKYTNINQENDANINSLMVEVINGFETIKNLNLESVMTEKISSLYVKSLDDMYIYDNINNFELFIKELVTYITLLLIEFIGFSLVLDNVLSVGEIITFTGLVTYFISPIRNIIDLNKEYFYALNSLKRANNLFDIGSTDLTTKTKFNIIGNIRLKSLSYSYNDYNLILNNINIDINKGDKVLILGNSGSGKSTILKLLSKYYVPKRDSIYLDGIDINDISISNLKDNVISISQEEIIFTDTIKNNIIMDRKIGDLEFVDVCRLVYVDEIVKDKFLGYDTKIEENGQNISGGQRQRIILARALLKQGNIILIDEGLNAVDVDLERKILKNIFKKYVDKTIIIVSHRLENMDLYNKVVRLNKGLLEDVSVFPEGDCYNAR